jgi:hypothetical protein
MRGASFRQRWLWRHLAAAAPRSLGEISGAGRGPLVALSGGDAGVSRCPLVRSRMFPMGGIGGGGATSSGGAREHWGNQRRRRGPVVAWGGSDAWGSRCPLVAQPDVPLWAALVAAARRAAVGAASTGGNQRRRRGPVVAWAAVMLGFRDAPVVQPDVALGGTGR